MSDFAASGTAVLTRTPLTDSFESPHPEDGMPTHEFAVPLIVNLEAVKKLEDRIFCVARKLGIEVHDKSPETVIKSLLEKYISGNKETLVSKKRDLSTRDECPRITVRSLPADEYGLKAEFEETPKRVPGGYQHVLVLKWISDDNPRDKWGHEKNAVNLLSLEQQPLSNQADIEFLDSLPDPQIIPKEEWNRWNMLLKVLTAVASLKRLALEVTVVNETRKNPQLEVGEDKEKTEADDDQPPSVDDQPTSVILLERRGELTKVEKENFKNATSHALVRGKERFNIAELGKPEYKNGATRIKVRLKEQGVSLEGQWTLIGDNSDLDRMKKAFEKLQRGEIANPHLGRFLMDPTLVDASLTSPHILTASQSKDLNEEQAKAVSMALGGGDLSLIWGPPGTGKTTVISKICEIAAQEGLRVLITSQSNTAVDNALDKIRKNKHVRPLRIASKGFKLPPETRDLRPGSATETFLHDMSIDKDTSFSSSAMERIIKKYATSQRKKHPDQRDNDLLGSTYERTANVVACTCSMAATLQDKKMGYFDLVIVDEVSKATPVEMLPALILGKKIVLVGDDRQLPPVFRDDEKSLKETLNDNPGVVDRGQLQLSKELVDEPYFRNLWEGAQTVDGIHQQLREQFRMHPSISKLINCFYDEMLRDSERVKKYCLDFKPRIGGRDYPANQGALWIDTNGLYPDEVDGGTSRKNEGESDRIMDIFRELQRGHLKCHPPTHHQVGPSDDGKTVRDLIEKYRPKYKVEDPKTIRAWVNGDLCADEAQFVCSGERIVIAPALSIAAITFYKAQKSHIEHRKNQENKNPWVGLDININTVDSFQGMEADVVVVSLVRSQFPPHSEFVTEFRRINVAFSRARKLLVILGNAKPFQEALVNLPHKQGSPQKHPQKIYGQIHTHIKANKGILILAEKVN